MLQDNSMLVWLTINRWTARKINHDATDSVLAQYHADGDAGRFWAQLAPKNWLAPIENTINSGRAAHRRLTLPWFDDGARILPAALFFQYSEAMGKARDRFWESVEDALRYYPQIRATAATRMNGLYRPEDYPEVDVLRRKYHFDFIISPIPETTDFRLTVNEIEKRKLETNIAHVHQMAVQDAYDRIFEVVNRLKNRLVDPNTKVFRNALVENAQELLEILPGLNITNDPKLTDTIHRLETEICTIDLAAVKESDSERKRIANRTRDFLADLAPFMGAA